MVDIRMRVGFMTRKGKCEQALAKEHDVDAEEAVGDVIQAGVCGQSWKHTWTVRLRPARPEPVAQRRSHTLRRQDGAAMAVKRLFSHD